MSTTSPTTALPAFYYVVFGIIEPVIVWVGAVAAFLDPESVYIQQAPWPNDQPPTGPLPTATLVTFAQLAHVCTLLGTLNFTLLRAARSPQLAAQPALQETVVRALLAPLVVGDVLHLTLTFWALGDSRWDVGRWNGTLWATIVIGVMLLVPRVAWHMGIGRYSYSALEKAR